MLVGWVWVAPWPSTTSGAHLCQLGGPGGSSEHRWGAVAGGPGNFFANLEPPGTVPTLDAWFFLHVEPSRGRFGHQRVGPGKISLPALSGRALAVAREGPQSVPKMSFTCGIVKAPFRWSGRDPISGLFRIFGEKLGQHVGPEIGVLTPKKSSPRPNDNFKR